MNTKTEPAHSTTRYKNEMSDPIMASLTPASIVQVQMDAYCSLQH